ncbi:MAG: DUF5678 domain-containing protein [archaeon]
MTYSNYDFFIKTDFSKYAGEWVGILGNKVVAHGASFKEVAEIVDREFNLKKVLITRIPAKVAQLL